MLFGLSGIIIRAQKPTKAKAYAAEQPSLQLVRHVRINWALTNRPSLVAVPVRRTSEVEAGLNHRPPGGSKTEPPVLDSTTATV